MYQRYGLMILLLVGIAMAIVAMALIEAAERMAACSMHGTADACCERGECRYRPASEESRPERR